MGSVFIANTQAGYQAMSRVGDGFPSPWMDVASMHMPTQIKDVIDWCTYIWYNSSTYRKAQERIVSYFLTELEYGSLDRDKSIGDDEKEKWSNLFEDVLGMRDVTRSINCDVHATGNGFATIQIPFRRYLSCPQCGSRFPLNLVANNPEFHYRFTGDFEFTAECPKCKVGRGYRGPFRIDDENDEPEKNLRIKLWRPQEIEILHDIYSGDCTYLWRIPADYKQQVRRGDLHVLERCPKQVLKAIKQDMLFRFKPGVMYHMREPTLSGILNRGWGLSRILTNFRDIWYVQVLRRFNEAIALDYLIPFRLITPAPRQGSGSGQGQLVDNFLSSNMGNFRSQIEQMIRLRRRDPARWNVLPFPVEYQVLGGEASKLAPRELLDQGLETMLNAGGSPIQFYRGDLQLQTAPVALRLFESDNSHLTWMNYQLLRWAVQQISQLLSWKQVKAYYKPVTLADDFQKQMAILQMAMGQQVSLSTALDALGLRYKEERRRMAEEARYDQQIQAEVQEEMEQTAFGQQIAKAGNPVTQAQQQQQPGQPGGGGAQGAPAGPSGPVTGMLQSQSAPQTPEDMLAQADSMARELMSLPETQRRSELAQLKKSHEAMHHLVVQKMNEIRTQARSAGQAMMLGQQGAQPQV